MEMYVPNNKVLYVDDESSLLASFSSLMRREGYQIQTLGDSTTILSVIEKNGPFALVISDQRMPGLDGVGVLKQVREVHPETIRVLLTGFASLDDTQRAINESGIARYMNKPWDDEELKKLARECVDQYNLTAENKYLTSQLVEKNEILSVLLDGTVGQTIRVLSHLLLYINPQAANQTERIRKLAKAILDLMPNLSTEERWDIDRALDLFNIGIAFLPPLIQVSLNKDGLQSLERFPVACNHHLLASDLIKDIPRFGKVANIIRYQAKNFDGTGKPDLEQVRGKDLPLGARLLHILLDLEKSSTENFRGRVVLEEMVKRPVKYDKDLIELILQGGASKKGQRKEASLTITHIRAGMIAVDDIKTNAGQVLLQRNTVITESSVKILQHWNGYDHIIEPIRVVYTED
jgi:response regulator RpfG family c-di-GMP phosphodiesterase